MGAKHVFILLILLSMCFLGGCAGRQGTADVPTPPTPLPPQEEPTKDNKKITQNDAAYREDEKGQYLAVDVPVENSSGPRFGEPSELADLLNMEGVNTKENTAVNLLRPAAIREAAQLVTFQTAIAFRYKQLLAVTEGYSGIMDAAFNFSPLLMTQDEALIMPPMLTRAGASMRIEASNTATAAATSYEMLEPAKYVSTIPTWRQFLMVDSFPEPEKPNPAVMPQNAKERAIWRTAVREAWAQGLAEADQLYTDNVSRMVRDYRGIMLYHLLTAQHLLSEVHTASADLGMKTSDNGNKLNIGQKVYRITVPSAFTASDAELQYVLDAKETNLQKPSRK